MYVIKKMRLNAFESRPLLSNRQLATSAGESNPTIVSKNTASCFDEPSIDGASKTKLLGLAEQIAKTSSAKHAEGDKVPSLPGKNAKEL